MPEPNSPNRASPLHTRRCSSRGHRDEPRGDRCAGEGYLARRVHDTIKSNGYAAKLEACDLFPENFRVPEVPCHAINLHGGLPFDDQSVDLAYSVEVLEHLEDQFLFFFFF